MLSPTRPCNRLTSLSDRFDMLLTRLNDGQNAGQLLKDKQLYENMNGGGRLRVVDAIKKDPKRSEREGQHLLGGNHGAR